MQTHTGCSYNRKLVQKAKINLNTWSIYKHCLDIFISLCTRMWDKISTVLSGTIQHMTDSYYCSCGMERIYVHKVTLLRRQANVKIVPNSILNSGIKKQTFLINQAINLSLLFTQQWLPPQYPLILWSVTNYMAEH